MTITAPVPAHTSDVSPDPTRSHARVAGIFYLLTFASSIPALLLIAPVLNDAGYVTSAGSDTRVLWGCLLDSVNALTAVGSAVAVYAVVKRQNGSMALGFVTSRLVEAAVVMIGVVSLLAVVTMRQDFAGSGADAVEHRRPRRAGRFALTVNPFDIQATADAIHDALVMPQAERHERIEGIRNQVREHDIDRWMQDQLDDLAEVAGVSVREALR